VVERRIVYREANGVRRTMILDDDNPSRVVVQTDQDLTEILTSIAHKRETLRPGADIKPVATIPIEIFERMMREGWGPDDEAKWLNSSEAAPFRIWRGNVGRDR
jgi:hypothetical protein